MEQDRTKWIGEGFAVKHACRRVLKSSSTLQGCLASTPYPCASATSWWDAAWKRVASRLIPVKLSSC